MSEAIDRKEEPGQLMQRTGQDGDPLAAGESMRRLTGTTVAMPEASVRCQPDLSERRLRQAVAKSSAFRILGTSAVVAPFMGST